MVDMALSLVGEVVIKHCRDLSSELARCMQKTKRSLGGREYYVYRLAPEERLKITEHLYSKLKDSGAYGVRSILLAKNCKSIIVQTASSKPLWYNVGLALSDGSVLGTGSIIFSTSTPHTINAVVYGFGNVRIYVARYMVSMRTRKTICIVNLIAHNPLVARKVASVKKNGSSDFVELLKNNREYLAQFIAGVIEGDGSIDKDGIRICVSRDDPIYEIVSSVFKEDVSYDSRKWMLRISTRLLREIGLLDRIWHYLVESHKKTRLERLLRKRYRFEIRDLKLSPNLLEQVRKALSKEDIRVLSMFRYRTHKSYTYAYVPVNSRTSNNVYQEIKSVFSKIGSIVGVDLEKAIKVGNREIVVYEQHVVNLLRMLFEEDSLVNVVGR